MDFFDPTNPIIKIILATLLGMFLGVRREGQAKRVDFAGIRTMAIIGLLGAISTLFIELPFLPIIILIGLIILIVIAYFYGVSIGRVGLTSEFSAFIVFLIGVLIGYEQFMLGLTLTVILALLLAFKKELHTFSKAITRKEWIGSLQLLIVAGVILPFLPNETIDPWGIFNPYSVWLFVVFIVGVGFAGYFLVKYFGSKSGILLTSFVGGFVSSTAVTTSNSHTAKSHKRQDLFAVGIMLAIGVMELRVVAEVLIFGTKEVYSSIFALVAMSLAAFISAFILWKNKGTRKVKEKETDFGIKNPFKILPALTFGVIFVILLALVHFATKTFGETGTYLVAALSSLVDVDAIVLSNMESLKNGLLDPITASYAVIIASVGNTIIKIGYASVFGSWKFGKKVAIPITMVSLVGVLVAIFFI